MDSMSSAGTATGRVFRKKTLFVRLLFFSIIIQVSALTIIGVFFYHNMGTEILDAHISVLKNDNQNVADMIQNELKTVISSAYAFALHNSIGTAITTTLANPDTGNEIKLNSLLSDTLEDAIFQSNKFIKTTLLILNDKIYSPTVTSANNTISIESLRYLVDGNDDYLTFYPRQCNPISHSEESIIPVVFHLSFGRTPADLIFFIDYQHLGEKLREITDTSNLLIVDSAGRTVFCENPLLDDNPELLQRDRPFSSGVFLSTVKNDTFLRTGALIASSQWTSYLFTEKGAALKEFNFLLAFLAGIFLVVFLLESVLYNLLYRRLTSPLVQLAHNMSHPIGKSGHTVYQKFEYEKDDEIGVLSKTYNEMIETIDQLVESLNGTIEDLKVKSEQVAWEQEQTRKAEIKALQAQINPHFLYNTLNSISWLAVEQNADKAARLTKDLASYYEISLSKGQSCIPLCREVEHLERYLDIQSVRHNDILSYQISISDEFMDICIPKITLQPLAENALCHGLTPLRKRGVIEVNAHLDSNDDLVITVMNNGERMNPAQIERVNMNLENGLFDMSSGYGIYNVNSRLKLTFGSRYGLYYYEKEGFTCVDVRIPSKGVVPSHDEHSIG